MSIEWMIVLGVSVLFNIIYCIKLLMKDEYIRRADNAVKMRDDRIDELINELGKKLVDDSIYISKIIKHHELIMIISDIDRFRDTVNVKYEIISKI